MRYILSLCCLCSFFLHCKKNIEQVSDCDNNSSTKHSKAVFLVLGQSNAANFGETKWSVNCANLYNFYNDELYPLQDPIKGSNGSGGSVWSRLAFLLKQEQFSDEIIIASVAFGGVRFDQFLPDSILNNVMLERIASLQNAQLNITHILWHQGESNHTFYNTSLNATENARQYENQFHAWLTQIRSLGIDAPVFVASTTRCGSQNTDIDLLKAQQNLQNDSLLVFKGPNTDLLGNEYRYDDCHFNSNGLMEHAKAWASILKEH